MPLRQDLLQPIAGANPSGESLRYAPLYDKIKEARREDPDIPQGDWQHVRKLASWSDVVKLTSDALAKQTKDLQLAVWLAEALLRREGLHSFAQAVEFLKKLMENFWETLYPELEDGETELRAVPLEWLGSRLDEPVRQVTLTQSGLTFVQYKQGRAMGFEAEATSEAKRTLRKQMIEEGKATPEEFDAAVAVTPPPFYQKLYADASLCISNLSSLDEYCNEQFGDAAPSFAKLRTALEEVNQCIRIFLNQKGVPLQTQTVVEEPEPEIAPAAVQSAPQEVVSVVPPSPPVTPAPLKVEVAPAPVIIPTVLTAEPRNKEEAIERVAAVAKWLRVKDCYNIDPFLMLRGLRWGELRYNGTQIDARMLEAPPAETRIELKRLTDEQKWVEVIEAGEQAMALPCGRGWLDLQRYVVNALTERGDWFKEIATAIRTELRGLLTDLPQLLEMSLTDGTPVANNETRSWILTEILPGHSVAPPAVTVQPLPAITPEISNALPPPLNTAETHTDDVFETALALARSGQIGQAIRAISDELARERTGRGRFQRRMQMAHLLLAGERASVAQPILEDLAEELDRRNLEQWEDGEAVAYPLTLLFRCLNNNNGDAARRIAIFERICRLAPAKAMELEF
jgi:type VI secretion system protein ImpA